MKFPVSVLMKLVNENKLVSPSVAKAPKVT